MKALSVKQLPKFNKDTLDSQGEIPPSRQGGAIKINLEEATELYDEAISLVKSVFDNAAKDLPIDGKPVADLVWRICENITLGDRGIIYLANRSTPRHYLCSQSVNVCILSILVGVGLEYETARLNELGIAALLHDIGMVRVQEIAQKPRRLTEAEIEEVRKHPLYGAEILQKMNPLNETALLVCKAHQAYKKRKGVSLQLPDPVKEYAQIVCLVDIYVAMTQPRPYREAKLSHNAIRELVGEVGADLFDSRVLKTLVAQIGIYPIGSWIKLNSNEIARVHTQNPNFPLRPVVEVLFDAQGRALAEPRLLDLFKKQVLYIKEPLDLSKLRLEKP